MTIHIEHIKDFKNNGDDKIFNYWNDTDIEKSKIFNVSEIGFDNLENSRKYNTYLDHINDFTFKHKINFENSKILSIASGICYIESKFLQNKNFSKLFCIDYSEHRIHNLAPLVIKKYNLDKKEIFLTYGDFDKFKVSTKFDIVIMCQAFHHFANPDILLKKIKNMTNSRTKIFVIAEPYFDIFDNLKRIIKHFVKYSINYKRYFNKNNFIPSRKTLYPSDPIKGDNHFSKKQYVDLFNKYGFKILDWKTKGYFQIQSILISNK